MRDLSLHILDLAQNSVRAGASLVEISVSVDADRLITLRIRDDGCGMSEELRARVVSPFATTRTTRKVGLGIPLMAQNARLTGGDIAIESEVGRGTVFTATLRGDSIDCLLNSRRIQLLPVTTGTVFFHIKSFCRCTCNQEQHRE